MIVAGKIIDDIVVNITKFESIELIAGGYIEIPSNVCIGWIRSGDVYAAPVEPLPSGKTIASKLSVMRYLKSSIVEGVAEWVAVRNLLAGNEDAKEEWDAASELYIDDVLLLQMAQVLGWDAAKIQLIFNEAADI